jgi:hypothetical protein
MLTVVLAEYRKLALNVQCHYAECHYAECHYANCRGTFSWGRTIKPFKAVITKCKLAHFLMLSTSILGPVNKLFTVVIYRFS